MFKHGAFRILARLIGYIRRPLDRKKERRNGLENSPVRDRRLDELPRVLFARGGEVRLQPSAFELWRGHAPHQRHSGFHSERRARAVRRQKQPHRVHVDAADQEPPAPEQGGQVHREQGRGRGVPAGRGRPFAGQAAGRLLSPHEPVPPEQTVQHGPVEDVPEMGGGETGRTQPR